MAKEALALLGVIVSCLHGHARGFALPEGMSLTRTYKPMQRMKVYVSDLFADPLNPKLGRIRELESYSCDPETPKTEHSSFFQRLLRDEYHNSSYSVHFGLNEYCKPLCSKVFPTEPDHKLRMYYKMYVDNFPVALSRNFTKNVYNKDYIGSNFAIPTMLPTQNKASPAKRSSFTVFNHLRFVVHTVAVDPLQKEGANKTSTEPFPVQKLAISDIEVTPMSIKQPTDRMRTVTKCEYSNDVLSRQNTMLLPEVHFLGDGADFRLVNFTYDVVFEPKDSLTFRTGFDDLRKTSTVLEANVLLGSAIIILLLGVVVFILRTNLRRVVETSPTEMDDEESTLVASGTARSRQIPQSERRVPHPSIHLKAIKNDIFRPPPYPRVYSLLVGFGLQFSFTLIGTCIFLFIFFKSQAHRGKVISMLVLFYLSTGTILGYTSSRIYMTINGVHWLSIAMITSLVIPGLAFMAFYTFNCLLWMEDSYYSLSFTELLWFAFCWLGLFVPQVYIGSYLGFSSKKHQAPCSVNLVPRGVDNLPCFLREEFVGLFGGILPFTVFFFTAYLVFYGIWINSSYSIVSVPLLFLSVQIYLMTCALVGIITTYFNLFHENYNWWWTSFFSAAGTGAWIFVASTLVSFSLLNTLQELALFASLNFVLSALIGVMSGSVSTVASYFFLRYIYRKLRVT